MWVNSIEEVKRKLEEDENMETEEGDDPLNPFSKQGETHHRSGKRKVVSVFWTAPNISLNQVLFPFLHPFTYPPEPEL
jgi:hypothetical protein